MAVNRGVNVYERGWCGRGVVMLGEKVCWLGEKSETLNITLSVERNIVIE